MLMLHHLLSILGPSLDLQALPHLLDFPLVLGLPWRPFLTHLMTHPRLLCFVHYLLYFLFSFVFVLMYSIVLGLFPEFLTHFIRLYELSILFEF